MITGEQAIEILRELKANAIYIDKHIDDILEDYRYAAEYDLKYILEQLINLDLEVE